jgi:hypothetical protein
MSTNHDLPESPKMGEQFENYIRCHIFVKKYFVLLDKEPEAQENQADLTESPISPDFKMRDKMNKSFYLEATFKANDFEDKINWCTQKELKSYQELDKSSPVFIAVALGGKPDNPQNLFLVPLHETNNTELLLETAFKYQIPLGKPVMPDDLWKIARTEYKKTG